MADQVDDTGLNHSLGEGGVDRLGEALETIDDGEQDVLHAPVLELIHDPQPELGAFGLLDPQTEDLLGAIGQNGEGEIHRLVANEPLVADLDPDGVEENDGVAGIQRPVLPFAHRLENCIGDR